MKIIQISDMHLCNNPADRPHGIDVWKNFTLALQKAAQYKPDLIMLTGDLCLDTGEVSIYERIRDLMSSFNIPWYALPGNHDNAEMMEAVLGTRHCRRQYYLTALTEGYVALILNSGDSVLSAADVSRIHKKLSDIKKKILVFIHHPIISAPVPYMERNYILKDRDLIAHVLMAHPEDVMIFCGHYHVNICTRLGNITQWIAPATYFQIDPEFDHFETDHRPPGFREIILDGDMLHTRVVLIS